MSEFLASKKEIMSMTFAELSDYEENCRGGCVNHGDTLSDLRQCAMEEIGFKLIRGRYRKVSKLKAEDC
jgi:hypothetical protein